jgi:hypothetical protein
MQKPPPQQFPASHWQQYNNTTLGMYCKTKQGFYERKNVQERRDSCTFFVLFNSVVPVALFNYGKLRILVSIVALLIIIVVKLWFKIWDPSLHKYGFNC